VDAQRHPHLTLSKRADEISRNADSKVEDGASSDDVRAAQVDPLCTRWCTKREQHLNALT